MRDPSPGCALPTHPTYTSLCGVPRRCVHLPAPLGPHANTCNMVGTGDQLPGAWEWVSGHQTGALGPRRVTCCLEGPCRLRPARTYGPSSAGRVAVRGPRRNTRRSSAGEGRGLPLRSRISPASGRREESGSAATDGDYCFLRALWPRLKPKRTATWIKTSGGGGRSPDNPATRLERQDVEPRFGFQARLEGRRQLITRAGDSITGACRMEPP